MDRRKYLISAGGAIDAVTGGTAVANATRADVLADSGLTRGKSDAVAIQRTITRDSLEYLESTDHVRENGHTAPFRKWARRESERIGANAVVSVVEDRFDTSVDGVGSGVRYLLFGPVVTADHTVTRDRDGSVVSEPNVSLDQLISVAPRTMTVTVDIDSRGYTTDVPVGVGHAEMEMDSDGT